jgi:hypothetical protein
MQKKKSQQEKKFLDVAQKQLNLEVFKFLARIDLSNSSKQVAASAKDVRDSMKAACASFTLNICAFFEPYFQRRGVSCIFKWLRSLRGQNPQEMGPATERTGKSHGASSVFQMRNLELCFPENGRGTVQEGPRCHQGCIIFAYCWSLQDQDGL